MVAFLSQDFELLTPKGMAFAKAAPNGTLYRMDIIPQPDYVPPKLPLPAELLDQPKTKIRGVRFDSNVNPLEEELVGIANKEPHHSQRVYHHRFNRVVGDHATRIMGEAEVERHRHQIAETEHMQHNTEAQIAAAEIAARRFRPHTTGAEILQQIAEQRKDSAFQSDETEAERVRRLAKQRSMHRRSMSMKLT